MHLWQKSAILLGREKWHEGRSGYRVLESPRILLPLRSWHALPDVARLAYNLARVSQTMLAPCCMLGRSRTLTARTCQARPVLLNGRSRQARQLSKVCPETVHLCIFIYVYIYTYIYIHTYIYIYMSAIRRGAFVSMHPKSELLVPEEASRKWHFLEGLPQYKLQHRTQS